MITCRLKKLMWFFLIIIKTTAFFKMADFKEKCKNLIAITFYY